MATKETGGLLIGAGALVALAAASSGSADPPNDDPPGEEPPNDDPPQEPEPVTADGDYTARPGELDVDATPSSGPIETYEWRLENQRTGDVHTANEAVHTFTGVKGGTCTLSITVTGSSPSNTDTATTDVEMPMVPVRPPLRTPESRDGYHVLESGGSPLVEISLFTSQSLASDNGRKTEHIIANTLADAFGARNFGYRIKFGCPTVSVPNQQPGCCSVSESNTCNAGESDALYHWRDKWTDVPQRLRSKDSNMLLLAGPEVDTDYLGCAGVGGHMAVARADAVNTVRERKIRATANDFQHRLEFTALHEVAHNLGVSHTDHMHNTTVDNDRNWWIRTPCGASGEIYAEESFCGYSLTPYEDQWNFAFANRYSDCAAEFFRTDGIK